MKITALLCSALLWVSGQAFAGGDEIPADTLLNPYGYAHQAEKNGDYPEALKIYKWLAETNSYAAFMIGIYYYEGRPGVLQDYRAALQWFTKAANFRFDKLKRPTIPTSLSGEKKKEAERLQAGIEESTRQEYMLGVPLADEWIGRMYYLGRGVPQDYVLAAKWFREAAEHGNAESQVLLGGMYMNGQGVPQDYVMAHMWFNLASAGLTGEARDAAANARDQIASLITPSQVAEAQRLAREWRPKQTVSNIQGRRK